MKYMVLLLAILAGVWLIKRQQVRKPPAAGRPQQQVPTTPMLACQRCGMHVPQQEAIQGRRGTYCCQAHRQADESPAP